MLALRVFCNEVSTKYLPPVSDRDLTSIQEARTLAERARQAAGPLAELTQEQVDAIVDAMAAATRPLAEEFARLAVDETGFGVVADKPHTDRLD